MHPAVACLAGAGSLLVIVSVFVPVTFINHDDGDGYKYIPFKTDPYFLLMISIFCYFSLVYLTRAIRKGEEDATLLAEFAFLASGIVMIGRLADLHGPLMVLGFMGSLISLERAQALRNWLAYAAPALLGSGALVLISGAFPVLGKLLLFDGGIGAEMTAREGELFHLHFDGEETVYRLLEQHGRLPLPPYIERAADAADDERYQTIYAKHQGAVAAPTAGPTGSASFRWRCWGFRACRARVDK